MGIGDWGLGIGDWGLGPITNPQSPCKKIIYFDLFNFKSLLLFLLNIFKYIKTIIRKV